MGGSNDSGSDPVFCDQIGGEERDQGIEKRRRALILIQRKTPLLKVGKRISLWVTETDPSFQSDQRLLLGYLPPQCRRCGYSLRRIFQRHCPEV